MEYAYCVEGGCEEIVDDARDLGEAIEIVEELVRETSSYPTGATLSVSIEERDEDGEVIRRRHITVDIPPDEEALIRAATWFSHQRSCGNNPDSHAWSSRQEGGNSENPGVWGIGGTALTIDERCKDCGLHRTRHVCGTQRGPYDHDRTVYTMPDTWCAICEREECEC